MILSFIAAIDEHNAIGKGNQLPWHLPEDLKFFKRTTLGKPVLMGRKSYESLGKPLPGRLNIVISKQGVQLPEGVLLYNDLQSALDRLQQEPVDEGFIIGGGQIFTLAMGLVDKMYLTRVHTTIDGADAFFPEIDHTHWKMIHEEAHHADEKHKYDYTFQQYERIVF